MANNLDFCHCLVNFALEKCYVYDKNKSCYIDIR